MSGRSCCPVLELRQYTLVPGGREVLIELFEREFIESQEAIGMIVVGQFRDLNNPDRFVWLRGFTDMASRAHQLKDFYGGPVWKKHRETANATMIDSDNVLLLRPARSDSGFSLQNVSRLPQETNENTDGLIVATIYYLTDRGTGDFVSFFERELEPELKKTGASILATFVTERHPNTFPALPVREDVNVFVCFSRFANREAYEQHASIFADSIRKKEIAEKLSVLINEPPEILMLAPTARSLLHG
jgi:quinol monooxygenase YgiN